MSNASPINKKKRSSNPQQPISHTSIYPTNVDSSNDQSQLPTDDNTELTLGQRLKANKNSTLNLSNDDNDKQFQDNFNEKSSNIPAHSLATLLTQSLNSNDNQLLESCLSQSDPVIIKNTINRLPNNLALPLLNQCTSRLSRPGKAGSQRAKTLLEWSRSVIMIHTAYLLSVPEISQRLLSLHSALSLRIDSHQPLLSLSGRLDLILSQIDLQKSIEEKRSKLDENQNSNTVTYIEGESDDEDIIEYDNDDQNGIEDVELGNGEDEEESDESDNEILDNNIDEDEDESGDEGKNAMIDDEAMESDSDDDDDDDVVGDN